MQLHGLSSSRVGQVGVPKGLVKVGDQAGIVAQQQAAQQGRFQAA